MVYTHVKSFTIVKNRKCGHMTWAVLTMHCSMSIGHCLVGDWRAACAEMICG